MSQNIPLLQKSESLRLGNAQLEFFQKTTGISDEAALKEHIVAVQREACVLKPYACLVHFRFTDLRLNRIEPGYQQLLALGKSRPNPILVDIGCCMGVDSRKVVFDGYPRDSVIATDIVPEFWVIGHKLFRSTPETFPVPFISGDVFDPAFLETVSPTYAKPAAPAPKLTAVKTLSELRGHVSAITICSVFHLFKTEEEQSALARAIACLLSPEPGSMIIGGHAGLHNAGMRGSTTHGEMYCHSPDSWKELWDGQIFKKGTVKVDAVINETAHKVLRDGELHDVPQLYLRWTVKRL
ncbi:hypothetical protein C8Q80DRAFT_1212744 [Daedaleopsis nitida]|nr:hypothetical protein C8Q80DRAFT_1212744 [Daedaleopsis nitida]